MLDIIKEFEKEKTVLKLQKEFLHVNIVGSITIEDNVWIGTNSIILQNVKVGAHSIIGAGSVVTKDIPEYSIVGGVPAKIIKSRKNEK